MWLQRPPTWMYFKRGWQVFLKPKDAFRQLATFGKRLLTGFVFNTFIFRRSKARRAGHWLIMWGTLLAVAITFPLVFGWIHLVTPPNDFENYIVYFFGIPAATIAVDGWLAFAVFHGLVWSSLLIIPGVMLAMRRRMRNRGAIAVQRFGEDILPLLMLFAISISGLLLWVSYAFLHAYGFEFLAIFHAATVIFTLVWLPFGKLFHIFQRPAQLGVAFYQDRGRRSEQARCPRCEEEFAPLMQVEDLIKVERQLGYRYEIPDGSVDHYQRVCPKCRRAMFAIAQGKTYAGNEEWSGYLAKEPAHGDAAR